MVKPAPHGKGRGGDPHSPTQMGPRLLRATREQALLRDQAPPWTQRELGAWRAAAALPSPLSWTHGLQTHRLLTRFQPLNSRRSKSPLFQRPPLQPAPPNQTGPQKGSQTPRRSVWSNSQKWVGTLAPSGHHITALCTQFPFHDWGCLRRLNGLKCLAGAAPHTSAIAMHGT